MIVKAFALEQQRRPVKLQPGLKHLSLAEAVLGRLGSSRVRKGSSHDPGAYWPAQFLRSIGRRLRL
jgi:hypothetical protein